MAIDIGATMVRVAEVELGSGANPRDSAVLHAYAERSMPAGVIRNGVIEEPASLAGVVRETYAAAKTSGKNVTVGIGHHSLVVREVDIPAQPMAQVRDTLAFHVQDSLTTSVDDAILDFFPTLEVEGQSGTSLRGLLVAAPKDMVRDVVAVVDKAGVPLTVVDHSALGLWRGGCRGQIALENTALVDVGSSATTIVLSQGLTPRLVRVLPQGSNDANKAIANAMKGTGQDAESMKREIGMDLNIQDDRRAYAEAASHALNPLIESIRNTLVYFASSNPGGAVQRIVLTGGGAYVRGFGQALASATRQAVQYGEPLAGIRLGKGVDLRAHQGREAELATVIGLAMGGER
ncbi:pilus assembly protein PilM [Demequina aurantiaca]|uniref:pilus assembly protein PilM n=1 Tax=Demequina aurantiaca TaxID=676200 RepID=UPI003D3588F5